VGFYNSVRSVLREGGKSKQIQGTKGFFLNMWVAFGGECYIIYITILTVVKGGTHETENEDGVWNFAEEPSNERSTDRAKEIRRDG